jgi:hypothetical protein
MERRRTFNCTNPPRKTVCLKKGNYSGWVLFVVFGCVFAALSTAPQKHKQHPG